MSKTVSQPLAWRDERAPVSVPGKPLQSLRVTSAMVHAAQVCVSVVIPALNEAPNLPFVLPCIPDWVDEVILVDGRSTDDTVEVARGLRPDIVLITQLGQGKGAALRCGLAAARGDVVVHLDADGSTDPAEIPLFVGALLAGADYVKGTRFTQGAHSTDMTPLRAIGNGVLVALANILFGTRFTDITYGYNALWRCHSYLLALEIDNWAHEIIGNIRMARSGLRVVEVACCEHERIAGQAKLRAFQAGWQILVAMVRERAVTAPLLRPVSPTAPLRQPALSEQRALLEEPELDLERELGGVL